MPTRIQQDFEIRQGDFRNLDFIIDQGDTAKTPVDITGYTGEWIMADGREGSALLTKSISVINGPAGQARVTLDPSDTVNFRGEFYHELEMIDGSSNPSVSAEGLLTIKAAVTR